MNGRGVVLSGYAAWSEEAVTPHYVAELLRSRLPVLYVEPPIAWHPRSGNFIGRRNPGAWCRPVRRIRSNLWAYTPLALPLARRAGIARVNETLLAAGVRRALARIGIRDPLLWLAETSYSLSLVRLFPKAPAVFHMLDLFVHPRDVSVASELARTCFLSVAASPLMAETLTGTARNVRIFPNGWDFPDDALAHPAIPADLAEIPRPRFGVVSGLGPNLDYGLLFDVVDNLPGSLVLIGRPVGRLSTEDRRLLNRLRHRRGVFFLGSRPVQALPGYIAGFDVCLMPYKKNYRIYASDPLKLYQYLALGKPVVSSPVQTAESLAGLVDIGRTSEEFVALAARALSAEGDPERARRCREFAERTRWPSRWKEFERMVKASPELSVLAEYLSGQ